MCGFECRGGAGELLESHIYAHDCPSVSARTCHWCDDVVLASSCGKELFEAFEDHKSLCIKRPCYHCGVKSCMYRPKNTNSNEYPRPNNKTSATDCPGLYERCKCGQRVRIEDDMCSLLEHWRTTCSAAMLKCPFDWEDLDLYSNVLYVSVP